MTVETRRRTEEGPPGIPTATPRRKRRLLRRIVLTLLIVVAALAALVASLPYLLSTGAGTALVAAVVNRRIPGRVHIGDLSLNWLGPSRVRGLKAWDPRGRKVLDVREATYAGGVWRALTDPERFERLTVIESRTNLYLRPDGRASIEDVFTRPGPPERKPGELPALRGRITLDRAEIRVVRADGQSYTIRNATGDWRLDTLSRASGRLELETEQAGRVRIDADLRELVTGGEIRLEEAKGTFRVRTEEDVAIGPLMALARRGPLGGGLHLDLQGRFDRAQVRIEATAGARGLHRPVGAAAKLPPVDLSLAGAIDLLLSEDRVRLDEVTALAGPAEATVSGLITGLNALPTVDLEGSYQGHWQKLRDALRPLAPEVIEHLAFQGATGGRFTVTGPVYQPTVRPVFKGLAATGPVSWSGGRVFGLALGEAKFTPHLEGGRIDLTTIEIPVGDGKARIGGTVTLDPERPRYQLSKETQVLEDVRLAPELTRSLLSRFNPVLAESAGLTGSVSLRVDELSLPLSKKILEAGRGRGRLDLSGVEVRPGGVLAQLTRLSPTVGRGVLPVRVTGMDFELYDGAVHYRDFALVFGELFDLRFDGSVGFDDRVEMAVSVPVTPPLLEKLGVRIPLKDVRDVLSGLRVVVPVRGTRLQPSLEWDKVDARALTDQLLGRVLKLKASDVLGGAGVPVLIPGPKPEPEGPKQPETPGEPEEPEKDKKPRPGSILDRLPGVIFDILEEKKDEDKGGRGGPGQLPSSQPAG